MTFSQFKLCFGGRNCCKSDILNSWINYTFKNRWGWYNGDGDIDDDNGNEGKNADDNDDDDDDDNDDDNDDDDDDDDDNDDDDKYYDLKISKFWHSAVRVNYLHYCFFH